MAILSSKEGIRRVVAMLFLAIERGEKRHGGGRSCASHRGVRRREGRGGRKGGEKRDGGSMDCASHSERGEEKR